MFKVKHKLYPETTGDIFMERINNQHNLRNRPDFITPHVHTLECLIDVPPFFSICFHPGHSYSKPPPPPPINYWGKFPTQKNLLKQYTYGDFFTISQKELSCLYCVLFCKFA